MRPVLETPISMLAYLTGSPKYPVSTAHCPSDGGTFINFASCRGYQGEGRNVNRTLNLVLFRRSSMPAQRSALEAGDNPQQYEELFEDWSSNADYGPSSFFTQCPFHSTPFGYLVIKRQTYPHWDKGMLKEEVVVKVQGSSEEPKSETTAGVDRTKEDRKTASLNQSHAQIRAAGSAAQKTPTSVEPNSAHCVRPSAICNVNSAHGHLNEPSSSQASSSTARLLPHLALATRFPAFDPRAVLLQSKSKANLKSRIPTFTFSRLQKMIADSASRSSISESPILRQLGGLYNQIQGSPATSFWLHVPFETNRDIERKSFVSGKYDDNVDSWSGSENIAEDDYGGSNIVDGWSKMRAETLSGLQSIKHASDDSFNPDFHSTSISELSDDANSLHESAEAGSGLPLGSSSTCGHRRHYARLTQVSDTSRGDAATNVVIDADDGRDFSFYFRSRPQSLQDSLYDEDDHGNLPGPSFPRRFYITDNMTGSYDSYGRPICASANIGTSSVTDISFSAHPHSRTSSHSYLSPGSGQRNQYFSASAFSTVGTQDRSLDEAVDDEDHNNDNHRVYFAQSAQTSSSSTGALHRLFTATRRRVSSISTSGKKNGQPPTYRSTPSAKEELEKTERQRNRRPSDGAKKRQRRVLHKRGRSSTVRRLDTSPVTPVISREVSPDKAAVHSGEQEHGEQSQLEERPALAKKERRASLLHRLFTQPRPGSKIRKTIEKSPAQESSERVDVLSRPRPELSSPQSDLLAASNVQTASPRSDSEIKTRRHEEQQSAPNETTGIIETCERGGRPKLRVRTTSKNNSAIAMLFRNFSLASPRTPGSARRRFGFGRE